MGIKMFVMKRIGKTIKHEWANRLIHFQSKTVQIMQNVKMHQTISNDPDPVCHLQTKECDLENRGTKERGMRPSPASNAQLFFVPPLQICAGVHVLQPQID